MKIFCGKSDRDVHYKNRLKDMVREGQFEGADADEFMLDLIDSISDQKAKELCIDYGVPISEEDV